MLPNNARYNKIGIGYDDTRRADPYLCSRMHELLQPISDGNYLDVGCGTGNYTSCLNDKGLSFIGVDPTEEMLLKAKLKNSNVSWMVGSAEKLDLPSESVDGVLVSLSIHHWSDLNTGFHEIARVMKPGSHLVLFTTFPEQTKAYWLNHYFPKMMEDSIAILPTREALNVAFQFVGLKIIKEEKYDVHPELKDWFLYCGKHNPSMYFEPSIRKGISSFSLLSNQPEVEQGLAQLKADIRSGAFLQIQQSAQSDLGDYSFLVARKLGSLPHS